MTELADKEFDAELKLRGYMAVPARCKNLLSDCRITLTEPHSELQNFPILARTIPPHEHLTVAHFLVMPRRRPLYSARVLVPFRVRPPVQLLSDQAPN